MTIDLPFVPGTLVKTAENGITKVDRVEGYFFKIAQFYVILTYDCLTDYFRPSPPIEVERFKKDWEEYKED
ncbi:MAG: hypothetical protein E7314_07670 [Clostridiales bacterium]|nr:hypothetical protein [Clostridiales bacterium]